MLPIPAWLELDRSRDNSERKLVGALVELLLLLLLLRGDRAPEFVVVVMDLMGL